MPHPKRIGRGCEAETYSVAFGFADRSSEGCVEEERKHVSNKKWPLERGGLHKKAFFYLRFKFVMPCPVSSIYQVEEITKIEMGRPMGRERGFICSRKFVLHCWCFSLALSKNEATD